MILAHVMKQPLQNDPGTNVMITDKVLINYIFCVAIHIFKWVKIIHICLIWVQTLKKNDYSHALRLQGQVFIMSIAVLDQVLYSTPEQWKSGWACRMKRSVNYRRQVIIV